MPVNGSARRLQTLFTIFRDSGLILLHLRDTLIFCSLQAQSQDKWNGPSKKTYLATPEPRLVVACGDCAVDGGIYKGSYAVTNGAAMVLPVDCFMPGCPPTPVEIIRGFVQLLDKLTGKK